MVVTTQCLHDGLLQTLLVHELVETFPAFCGTRRFMIVFKTPRHLSMFRARLIRSNSYNPVSLISSLTICHQPQGLPSGLFPLAFPIKTFCAFLLSAYVPNAPTVPPGEKHKSVALSLLQTQMSSAVFCDSLTQSANCLPVAFVIV